ncbi:MAG: hypothetical protein ACI8P9_000348 [Parasphingorhabdus sp.]|jgi:hypothetical protein
MKMSFKRRLIAILWPSFVCASIFSALSFAFIDPLLLADSLGVEVNPRLAGYSITFLVLWALGALSTLFGIAILRTPKIDGELKP